MEQVKKPDKKSRIMENINSKVMEFNGLKDINSEPKLHVGLNPFFIQMRHEVQSIGEISTQVRRQKLKQLFIQDFLEQDRELRQVDLAFMETQP